MKKSTERKVLTILTVSLTIFILLALLINKTKATEFNVQGFLNNVHVRVGVAYKLSEPTIVYLNSYNNITPIRKALSARIGIWHRTKGIITINDYIDVGIDHHSQWSEGAPFNDRKEYGKTELFLDYTFILGDL